MPNVFTQEALDHFDHVYRTEARPMHGESARGGCMRAVYIGLGALFGERFGFRNEFHKAFFKEARKKEKAKGVPEGRFNTIDRVFRALEDEGVAFPEQRFKPKNNQWELPDDTFVDSLEDTLHGQISGLVEGSYFFGVAVDGAIHSILLRLDNHESNRRTFWMDQMCDGFDNVRPKSFVTHPEITGNLDDIVRGFGNNVTMVWEFNPEAAVGHMVPTDTDGDGDPDALMPAVEEVEAPGDAFL